jgi:hypothetical protein
VIKILVLYEDARAPNGTFGPHDLVLGCVADERKCSVYTLQPGVRGVPIKGVGNLLKALWDVERLSKLAPGNTPILAVVDEDHIGDHIQGKSASEIEAAIRARCSDPGRVTIVLLQRNLESVILAIRECGESEAALIQEAIAKNLNARDILLGKVGNDPRRKALRDCVRERVPSLDRLVMAICAAMG